MENSITETIEKLYDKAETFGKTSISLAKHIAVFNIADVVSNLAVKLSISIVLGLSFLFANIGLAIYLGEVLLSLYKGFLIVAGFYLIVALSCH